MQISNEVTQNGEIVSDLISDPNKVNDENISPNKSDKINLFPKLSHLKMLNDIHYQYL